MRQCGWRSLSGNSHRPQRSDSFVLHPLTHGLPGQVGALLHGLAGDGRGLSAGEQPARDHRHHGHADQDQQQAGHRDAAELGQAVQLVGAEEPDRREVAAERPGHRSGQGKRAVITVFGAEVPEGSALTSWITGLFTQWPFTQGRVSSPPGPGGQPAEELTHGGVP